MSKKPYLIRVIEALTSALIQGSSSEEEWLGESSWTDMGITEGRFCLGLAIDSARRLDEHLGDRETSDTIIAVLQQGVIVAALDRGVELSSIKEKQLRVRVSRAFRQFGMPDYEEEFL